MYGQVGDERAFRAENQVCVGTHTHTAPSLIVVVVFGLHEGLRHRSIVVVPLDDLIDLLFGQLCVPLVKLNESHDAVVDDGDELPSDAVPHEADAFVLYGTYPIDLDEDLVGHGGGAHDAPRCTIVLELRDEERTTLLYYLIVLSRCIGGMSHRADRCCCDVKVF